MEETVSGFSVSGSWGDVVEHGERITRALHDSRDEAGGIDAEAFEEWDEWRPKSHERMDTLNEKTAEQAAVGEGPGEQAGKSPDEDLKTAGEKLSESYEKLEEDTGEAVDKWGESIDYVARAADSAGRRALRKVEGAVYRNVMTQMSPYYFDNDLVSANLQRAERNNPEYRLEVNVNDDDLKIRVSNRLADYERSVERWHIDTEKDTEILEAVEGGDGVDVPEDNDDARPTAN
ncbi:DUF5828 family protein [Halomarina oriensis]|uniref:Uncharacterized protein n=1 Tax=Halomarina oriensis TaxID=671145 RepID=A0A6B0GKP8_9EURY|nr:DUF5828 family protein [Halomarina oriensis]MWG34461.1 hypothetical protein [Halomarina oriensis]